MQAEALREKRADIKNVIALQTRQAWLNLTESRERVKVTQKALAQGEENLKVTNDQFKQGLTTNTTVLEAESPRTKNHGNHVNASHDAGMAIAAASRYWRPVICNLRLYKKSTPPKTACESCTIW